MRRFYTLLKVAPVFVIVVISLLILGTGLAWATRRTVSDNARDLQQSTPMPFLRPPFYGTAGMNSIFDHEYPIYLQESGNVAGDMIHNSGQRVVGPGYSGHNGIDYGMTFGPVLAAASGRVIEAQWARPDNHRNTYGLYVSIDHQNGYLSRYAHLSSIAVTVGTDVVTSDIIGVSGNTGNSTGPHLHFDLKTGSSENSVVNPYGWIGGPQMTDDPWNTIQGGPVSYQLWSQFPALSQSDVYTSGQPLPPPPPPNEATSVIVDDLDPQFQITTSSCEQESAGYSGHLYYSFALSRTAPTCAVRWGIPVTHTRGGPGSYDVYAYIPDRRSETQWAAYQIQHQGITSEATISQLSTQDSWVFLGKYRFDWNNSEYVSLSNVTIETTTVQIAFDAIMFAPASDGPQPTATPGPTPTLEPVTSVINAPLNSLSQPSQLDTNGHTSSVIGTVQALTDPGGRQYFRFNPTDTDVERVTFHPGPSIPPGNSDLALGNTADNSFTVDLMFRPAVDAKGVRTLTNALWDNDTAGERLGGWRLALNADTRLLAFTVYDSNYSPTSVTVPLSYDPASPPWIRVKAIKHGVRDNLYLCTQVGASAAQVTQGVSFAMGVYYWPGTTVDLGTDFRSNPSQPLNPDTSWEGDLDQFVYERGVDESGGCTIPVPPAPTRTLTPTATPVPATPLPPATIVHLPMNEGFGTPLADRAGNHPVTPANITIVPGTPGNGNARAFPQATNYSQITFGRNSDYYLADSAVRSMTVEIWFRFTGVAGLPTQTMANVLAKVNAFLRGWDLTYSPGTKTVEFNVYTGGSSRTAWASIANAADANQWVRVRAIKDGDRGKLVLCTAINGANWRVAEANFTGGIDYFRVTPTVTTSGTSLDLGVSYNPYGLNANWHGDLDEFLYTNRAEYTGGCQPIPTPTPTRTPTPIPPTYFLSEPLTVSAVGADGVDYWKYAWYVFPSAQYQVVGYVVEGSANGGYNQWGFGRGCPDYLPGCTWLADDNWQTTEPFRECAAYRGGTIDHWYGYCAPNGYTTVLKAFPRAAGTANLTVEMKVRNLSGRFITGTMRLIYYGSLPPTPTSTITPTATRTATFTPSLPTSTRTNTPPPSATAVQAFQESGGLVVMEAENYDGNLARSGDTWTLRSDVTGYVGAGFMRTEPDDGNSITSNVATTSPEINYRMNVNTPGTYYVWLRVHGEHGGSDSVHVGLDGQTAAATSNIGFGGTGSWRWTGGGTRQLIISTAGIHTINVWMREDGARVDRIVLTTDGNYTPSGNGPAESPRTASSPTATSTRTLTPTSTPTRTNTPSGPTPTPTSTSSSGGLPAPWVGADVGSVGVTGNASYSGGTFTVNGSGADIWSTSDSFHFVYQPITGDVTLTTRVVSLSNTNGWAKAGVMIRESLSAESRHAMTVVSYANGVAFQRRNSTGGNSTNTSGAFVSAPYWVRLVRSGSTLTGYQSIDGVTWQVVGSETINLPPTVYVGLAVTAHNNSVLNAATFGNVTLSTAGGPTPTSPPGPTSTPSSATCLSTGVLDNFNRTNGFVGINWSGATNGYAIAGNRLAVGSGRDIYWNPASFGSNQEVCVTLVTVDTSTAEIGLILKSQSSSSQDSGVIEVAYNPYNVTDGQVEVWTYTTSQGWVHRGNVVAGFANGDRFGARATAAGQVEVYKNGVLLGSKSVTAWPYYASGGYIGLWMAGDGSAGDTILGDFAGGTVP